MMINMMINMHFWLPIKSLVKIHKDAYDLG